MRVMHVFANNPRVPYLTWFAQRAATEGGPALHFVVMFPERPPMVAEMQGMGFRAEWVHYDQAHRKRGMLRALPRLWWTMMRNRPDIVHAHLFDDTLPAMLAAWLARVRVRIYTRQDTGFHANYAPRWNFLDRIIARLATRAIACSEDARRFMIDREGIPAAKVGMVHHGVPPEAYLQPAQERTDRLRLRFGLDGAFPVIGTVARLIEWKGHRHILDAAALLVRRHPRARFLFSGTGPLEQELRALVNARGLGGHVIFTGWVEREDMPALYHVMDLYLHAADHEPFGFVYAEAMFSGVPVVTTCTGAAHDAIVDGVNGILVGERTGDALAAGVARLLDGDPKAIGAAGRSTALQAFTFAHMWQGYMNEYHAAMRTGSRRMAPGNDHR